MTEIRDEDIEVIASSALRYGRGGQQVAPRPGVVVIHRPTGIAVICEDERSQHANKASAIAKLRAVIAARPLDDALIAAALRWNDDGNTTDEELFLAVREYRAGKAAT